MEAGFGFGPDINMKFFADLEGPGLASEPLLQFGTEGRTGTDSKAPSFELWLGLGVAKRTHLQTYSSFTVGFKD